MFETFTGAELITLLGVIGGGFLGLGRAIQWYVARLDAKTQKAMQTEFDLRRSIEKSFEERIQALEDELTAQKNIIADMNKEKQVYLRRIYLLEATLHFNKVDVPAMEGWPP